MAKTIERVRLDSVFPLVDEFGNEYLNRDYSLDVNKAYVSELAASFKNGEPDEPITLVRDGDVYRIKAGNSRVRAMKELGTVECWAVIDDEGTAKAINETVVRTNVKKKYEQLEESRFVQQLFLFGDDEYVGQTASIGAENAGRLRRARQIAGDLAGQISLDQLYAVDEFDGFPEQQKKILKSEGDNWKWRLDEYRREKRDIEETDKFETEASRLKIELVKDIPEDKRYISCCRNPDKLSGLYMEASASYQGIVGRIGSAWSGVYVDFYGVPLESVAAAETAAEAARRRKTKEYIDILESIDESTLAWVRGHIARGADRGLKQQTIIDKVPGLAAMAYDEFTQLWFTKDALKFMPECRGWGINLSTFAIGYKQARRIVPSNTGSALANKKMPKGLKECVEKWVAWVGVHMSDGWEPDEGQGKVLRKIEDMLAEQGGES